MMRRDGRVVECTALERRHTRKGIQGSNPCLSAKTIYNHIHTEKTVKVDATAKAARFCFSVMAALKILRS